jgi:hypothetical protein
MIAPRSVHNQQSRAGLRALANFGMMDTQFG